MFVRTIEPAFYDTDALGHINNTRLPAWFELARNDLFKLFTPDLDPKKWQLMLARIDVEYRAEMFYGHDIEIRTYLSRLGNSSFTVTQEAHQNGVMAGFGNAIMIYYDHQEKCSIPIDGELRDALTAHLRDEPSA